MTAAEQLQTSPYQQACMAYLANGWTNVLPLPPRAKKHPPSGYTGQQGTTPTIEQYEQWLTNANGNIALRLPDGIIGLDVDHYNGKTGWNTLQQLEQKLGPLPDTFRSTSRDDRVSGIRFYQTPTGLQWPGEAGPGIDIIQHTHRYAVVWPSIHPEGGTYYWIDDEGNPFISAGTHIDNLPELPEAWVTHLTNQTPTRTHERTDTHTATHTLQQALTPGDPCNRIWEHVNALQDTLDGLTGNSRHEHTRTTTLQILSLGNQGHHGAETAITLLRTMFIDIIGLDRGRSTAAHEYDSLIHGAAALLEPNPIPEPCYGDTCERLLPSLDLQPTTATTTNHNADADTYAQRIDDNTRYSRLVDREYELAKARDEARRKLTQEQAANRYQLPDHTLTLTDELALPDETIPYVINELWPVGGNITLTAAYKSGKTTTINTVIKALADGEPLFGRWGINHTGRIAVWNYEVSRNQYRTWLRERGITNTDKITILNMRGTRWTLTDENVINDTINWLRNHQIQTWIIDPLARAFIGCGDENSNQDVGNFLDTLDYIKEQAGVANLLIAAHTGRNAEQGNSRARGASRFDDWADARWMLTKDDTDIRFFSADGRDVNIEQGALVYDPETRDQRFTMDIQRTSSRQLKNEESINEIQDSILKYLKNRTEPVTKKVLCTAIGQPDTDASNSHSNYSKALDYLVTAGRVLDGRTNGKGVWSITLHRPEEMLP